MRLDARIRLACALALALAAGAPVTQAQGPPADTPAAVPADSATEADATGFETPQASVRGFLVAAAAQDWRTAADHLDLRGVPDDQHETLARELSTVLDRTLLVEVDGLSTAPEGAADDGQPGGRDLVGRIATADEPVNVYVERVRAPDGALEWKIARTTVRQIPALHDEFGYGPLAAWLPAPFFELTFLRMQLWQWAALPLLVALAAFGAWLLATVALRLARGVAGRTSADLDNRLLKTAKGPFELIVGVGFFNAGVNLLWLPVTFQDVVRGVSMAVLVIAATWLGVRLIVAGAAVLQDRWVARGDAMATSVVPLVRRIAIVVVVGLGGLAALQGFGVNVTALVAGFGLGGLAVALAAQKTLENLFAGISILVDQPIRVGDFCRFGDRLGTIEEIGLRSTRVRTLDRTVVTVPNSEFSALQLENFARRDRIWLSTTLGLRYETTPDQLRWVLVKLKELLLAHPKVDPSPARVRFAGFGAFSLDVEIFAYVLTADFNEFCAIREDLFLRMMDVVTESGSGFAFPSQTIYAGKDDGLDAERGQRAEAQVREWRTTKRLPLPDVTPGRQAELARSLDYPPVGSPDHE